MWYFILVRASRIVVSWIKLFSTEQSYGTGLTSKFWAAHYRQESGKDGGNVN